MTNMNISLIVIPSIDENSLESIFAHIQRKYLCNINNELTRNTIKCELESIRQSAEHRGNHLSTQEGIIHGWIVYNDTRVGSGAEYLSIIPVVMAKFKHDCESCIFLGHHRGQDLYFCKQGGLLDTVIARYGDIGSEYNSGMCAYDAWLGEAKLRARAMGLVR